MSVYNFILDDGSNYIPFGFWLPACFQLGKFHSVVDFELKVENFI